MINVNKTLYYALAAICVIFAIGLVVSKIVRGESFDFATDGMLLVTTVAGWLFAKNNKGDNNNNDKTIPPQSGSADGNDAEQTENK